MLRLTFVFLFFVLYSFAKDVNLFLLDLRNDGCCSVEKAGELLMLASGRLDRAHDGMLTYNTFSLFE